jgi:hypothetical protein
MKTISVLVLLQRYILCPKTKIYAFSFENTKVLNVLSFMYSRYSGVFFENTVQAGSLYFVELFFGKGSETRKRIKCFYLCVMSNAFIFDGFLSMGDICFSVLISKAVSRLPVLLMYYSRVFWE